MVRRAALGLSYARGYNKENPPILYTRMSISPDGKQLVLNLRDRQEYLSHLYLFDLEASSLTRLNEAEGESGLDPDGPTFTPDGNAILYAMRPREGGIGELMMDIFRYDLHRQAVQRLTKTREHEFSPVPLMNGWIAFIRANPTGFFYDWTGRIILLNPANGREEVLWPEGNRGKEIRWLATLPDRSLMSFVWIRRYKSSLFSLPAGGRPSPTLIGAAPREEWFEKLDPSFSADGSLVVYVGRTVDTKMDIGKRLSEDLWVAKLDEGTEEQITRSGFEKESPVFSPNGREVFYVARFTTSDEQGRTKIREELWRVNLAEKREEKVATLVDEK
jgi:Tol biopolymer transport system component